ncbi:MAG TPA: hypothetical protein VL947_03855 [Cytophagales bacterium]|nr:hypothetical protein [Cytophagales bacterium]
MNELLDDQDLTSCEKQGRNIYNILAKGYSYEISEAFNLGLKIYQVNLWSHAVFVIIELAIAFVLNTFHPIGTLISIIITPVIQAGHLYVAHKSLHGEVATFESFFDGFRNKFVSLVLNSLIISGFALLIFAPLFLMGFMSIDYLYFLDGSAAVGYTGPLMLFAVFISLCTLVVFQMPLLLFEHLGPWEALKVSVKMSLQNYWLNLGLSIVLIGLNVVGLLIYGIGLVFTIPLSLCTMYATFNLIIENEENEKR